MTTTVSGIHLPIIGYHVSPMTQKFGIPRQPNLVNISSVIEFVPPFDTPAAFEGIEAFSHLWVLWQFHQNRTQTSFRPQVRPPRMGGNAKTGVFATRSMYRPSGVGLSVVRLERVERVGEKVRLHIMGADMVDGTPILDVKPYLAYADSVPEAVSGAIDKPSQKTVRIAADALAALQQRFDSTQIENIRALIAQDPRPAYRQDEVKVRCVMRYDDADVAFEMAADGALEIVSVAAVDFGG